MFNAFKTVIFLTGAHLAISGIEALAQPYPIRPIQLLLSSAPGGGTDIVGRLIAKSLSETWKQSVVIVNKPGADGTVATEIAAKASPDGYTLLMVSSSHGINPALRSDLRYDTLKDFAAITQIANQQLILVVHPNVPAKTVKDLIVLAKANPGGLNYGSSTVATALPMELFKSMAGANIVQIPFRGTGMMMIDLLGGQIQTSIAGAVASIPHIKSGKLRALGIAGYKRSSFLPDLPTIAESGVPGYQATVWTVMLAPIKISRARLSFLNREVVKIIKSESFEDRLHELGSDGVASTPEEADKFVAAEIVKWTRIVKDTGMKSDGPN